MRTVAFAGIVAIGMFALGIACLGQREACAQEENGIGFTIPWSDSERAEYVLLDHDDPEVECGTGALTVERQGDEYRFTIRFEDEANSDTSTITVDAETLQPSFVRRERLIDGETEAVEGEYDREEEAIRVVEFIGDDEPRPVPRRLDEDVYYDNESSLFLWRTIPFEEGVEIKYTAVLVNRGGAQREVTLRVVEKQEVTVPAGTFDAWRVDMHTEGVNQVAFFADTPERQLVFYDNSVQVFQLTSFAP